MKEQNRAKVIQIADLKVACKDCTLYQLCLPIGLNDADLTLLDRIIKRRRPVKRGDYLYRSGQRFESIFAVKSGSFKTFCVSEDGREQVTGMFLPGELFGLDAISTSIHACSAIALERSSVCEIPFHELEVLGKQIPNLLQQIVRIMSKEISRDKRVLQATKSGAESKLATFLLSLSERYRERGFAASEFRLSMSRGDIGNYLGLAEETVSRLFTRFEEQGLLGVERKEVHLLNLEGLRAVARGGHGIHPSSPSAAKA
jgi:CRP/FNR family transcriptional regulator